MEVRLFKRYAFLFDLYNRIKLKFPNLIKLNDPGKTWIKIKKSKTIETRKIFIESFLQVVVDNYAQINSELPELEIFMHVPIYFLQGKRHSEVNSFEKSFSELGVQVID